MYKDNSLIIFTKAPIGEKVKTKLGPHLSKDERESLQRLFLLNIKDSLKLDVDVFICYESDKGALAKLEAIFGNACIYFHQEGNNIGEKMYDAFKKVFKWGYKKIILIRSDIPELSNELLQEAYDILDYKDFVFTPSMNGGYSLVGMKEFYGDIFNLEKYSDKNVLKDSLKIIKESGMTFSLTNSLNDIDTYDDLMAYMNRMEDACTQNRITSFIRTIKTISIIIPICNEEKTIVSLINSLDTVKDAAEIIFVDGGSQDKTIELIPDKYKLIKSVKGRAFQMNEGAKASTGDILFFLQADSVLPQDFLDEIKKANKASKVGAFGIKYKSKNFFMYTAKWINNLRTVLFGVVYGNQGMFIDRDLFFDLGMFKEIPIMEDVEFSQRLRERNIPVKLTKNRIISSDRRLPQGTIPKLKLMWKMNRLRKMFRDGTDINKISEIYRDIH